MQAAPFCGPECQQLGYASHRTVCGSLGRPLLPSQLALRAAMEEHLVRGLTGPPLVAAVVAHMQAVQRSHQAAAVAAAAAAGVVDE